MDLDNYYNKKTKTLILPANYNKIIKEISNEIEIIIFHENSQFNKPIDKLPKNLISLTFGKFFNQPVDNLPENLTHLTFNKKFNQPVDNLPKSLTHLSFGFYFNQPVDNLPKSLTHLTFSYKFNQPVDFLPKNLTHLTFGRQTPVRLAHPKIFIIFEMS
jgi:hypothetical protein